MNSEKSLGQVAYEAHEGPDAFWRLEGPGHKQHWEDTANEIERALRLAQHQDYDYRAMRSLLLRIHSARVAMNEAAVIAALDDVDAFFREENTN